MTSLRVLVTGGCGFIGSHVVDDLVAADHTVRILDDLSTAHPRAAESGSRNAELIVGDVADPDVVRRAVRGMDAVTHQAAKVGLGRGVADLTEYVRTNDLGTAALLSAMADADVGRLVLASSMVVYGEGGYDCQEHGAVRPEPRRPEDLRAGRFEPRCPVCHQVPTIRPVAETAPLDPRNGYAATKVAQEHLAGVWADVTGGTAMALRYHNVYGRRMPRDTPYAGVAARFRSALAAGRAPTVFEDGQQRRDFVHVTDVARANLAALSRPAPAGPGRARAYNVASGTPTTVLDLATELAAVVAGPVPVVTGGFRVGDVRHVVAAPSRAAAELGFQARTALVDGLADFAAEFHAG